MGKDGRGEDGRGGRRGGRRERREERGRGERKGDAPPTQIPGSAPEQWGPETDV